MAAGLAATFYIFHIIYIAVCRAFPDSCGFCDFVKLKGLGVHEQMWERKTCSCVVDGDAIVCSAIMVSEQMVGRSDVQ